MARRHTQLAKSRLLQYTEIMPTSIPVGTTVNQVSTLPSTVDLTKQFIFVTSTSKYYRIAPKSPVQYDAATAEGGLMMGEPGINIANGYEAIFAHAFNPADSSTTATGLSIYKPMTESVTLNSTDTHTPTAQAVSSFVTPGYVTEASATPSFIMKENMAVRCTSSGVTSLTLSLTDMVDGPKTRPSFVYLHTGTDGCTVTLSGSDASTMVVGDLNLDGGSDYVICMKDDVLTISKDAGAELYESVTYSQLVSKINNSQLVKGRMYRITDYVTTTTQTNTSSAGHVFDLVVTAIDVNELDCNASALLHSGDTYFSTAGADLSKWQIWYDVNNDTTKYSWADSTNGKGVIYRMIDEWRNDCPYDFKNILFTKANSYTSAYTFNKFTSGDTANSDYSLLESKCIGNVIEGDYYKNLNFIVLFNDTQFGSSGNKFGINCNDILFNGYCSYNIIDQECYEIVFNNSTYNYIGYGCSLVTFSNNCAFNILKDECYDITFGSNCTYNEFNGLSSEIQFGNNCFSNIVGYLSTHLTFGNNCSRNKSGIYCNSINFVGSCVSNTLGDNCGYIEFGNAVHNITIGGNCNSIVFGNSSTPSIGGDYCKDIVIESGNNYIRVYNTTSPSSSNYLQNIYIAQGCSGTSNAYTEISTIARNLAYRTTVGRDSSGNIRIYNEDDPASASQAQANWNETSSSSPSYIQNKPTLTTVTFRHW